MCVCILIFSYRQKKPLRNMPRLRKRGVVGEVVEKKKAVSPEVEIPSGSTPAGTTANAARTSKRAVSKTKALNGSSENKLEATTPTGVVKKKPPTPPQARVGKGGIQKSFRGKPIYLLN